MSQRCFYRYQVGCKAVLLLRHSIFTPVVIKAPTYLEQEHTEQMIKSIDNQDMFTRESEEGPHCITLDITEVEKYVKHGNNANLTN